MSETEATYLDLKNAQSTLLHSVWFYGLLDLELKSARTTLLDWFYDILEMD